MSSTDIVLAAAGSGGGNKTYVDDVFSTYLYTGNDSTQTITNGIDLAGEDGMVWIKRRSTTGNHYLFDTNRGASVYLSSNLTNANATNTSTLAAFNSDGFSLNSSSLVNIGATNYASWTFREQPKFFDVVTYTGNSTSGRTVAHNLGSVPGMIIVKCTSTTGDWQVYHRSTGNTSYLVLNLTNAQQINNSRWNSTTPTATEFTLGNSTSVNGSGNTYVAYLFAHDAGGFGESGTDNVISCGSYTGEASDVSVSLGYEPQFLLVKNASAATNWYMVDNMRGLYGTTAPESYLYPNLSNAEATDSNRLTITSTGFIARAGTTTINDTGNTYIYMAIRRPMKPPTSGTEVFSPIVRTGTGVDDTVTGVGFSPDLVISKAKNISGTSAGSAWRDRLRGKQVIGSSYNPTAAEVSDSGSPGITAFNMDGISVGTDGAYPSINENTFSQIYINHFFKRATVFFDVVCYTGNGSYNSVAHNLTVAPELIIVKSRSTTSNWQVYIPSEALKNGYLNTTASFFNAGLSSPTSTLFYVNPSYGNVSGATYVAYLFATCAGVSKVGSYTGTGATQTINCGFTGGARFVLIKRTDSTGDWYVWDTARGIISGNDPYLLMNSTAAEVTSTDYIDPVSSGFEISSTAPAAINASGGSFIYLAIA